MDRIVLHSRVQDDGVLRVNVPLGTAEAAREVKVTIEPAEALSQEEWKRRILSVAGKWEGNFERPDQGEYEEREGFDEPSA